MGLNEIVRFTSSVLTSTLIFSSGAFAVDLDYAAAKRRWEVQAKQAENSKRRYESLAAQLTAAKSDLASAARREQEAREALTQSRNSLNQLDNNIGTVERNLSDEQAAKERFQRDLREVHRELRPLYPEQKQLEQELARVDGAIQDVNRRIADLEKDKPDDPMIATLKQRKTILVTEQRRIQGKLYPINNQIANLEDSARRLKHSEDAADQNIRNYTSQLSSYQRDRDQILIQIADDQETVRRTGELTDTAQRNVDTIAPQVTTAYDNWADDAESANELYAYYQEVIANYEAAVAEMHAKADRAAGTDGSREARDRAPGKGSADGVPAGDEAGRSLSRRHVSERELAFGYADGFDKASTDATLAASYAKGNADGELYALEKARLENLPLGYNRALSSHLSALPLHNATLDITTDIGGDPGGSGNFLNLADKAVGSKPDPSPTAPREPVYAPPGFKPPTISVPGSLQTYFDPAKVCVALALPEFEKMCHDRYAASYYAAYDSAYQVDYRAAYQVTYTDNANKSYQAGLKGADPASYSQGRSLGATHKGITVGFARSIDAARKQAEQEGVAALQTELKTGAYLVVREASLAESSGDQLFTPKEKVTLTLVIDNYGLEASARAKARVKVVPAGGVGAISVAIRELPALAPGTRTVLRGVVNAPITAEYAGETIAVGAHVETERAGKWTPLKSVAASAQSHFPLELIAIDLPRDPKLAEEVTATLKFKNLTANKLSPSQVKISAVPGFVTIAKPDISVSALEPQETVDVSVAIKTTEWVPENSHVRIYANNAGNAELPAFSQPFAKYIHLDRSISLLLLNGSGKAIPSSTFQVPAGQDFYFLTQMAYHAKVRLPGPFSLRFAGVSHPNKVIPANITTGDYGSFAPGQTFAPVRQVFRVDPSLKGVPNVYAMFAVWEGNQKRHVLMVYFDVK